MSAAPRHAMRLDEFGNSPCGGLDGFAKVCR
jgi:hypothetical protein